jgi:hypothetical protein
MSLMPHRPCAGCRPTVERLQAEIDRLRAVVASYHVLAKSSVGPAATARAKAIEECAAIVEEHATIKLADRLRALADKEPI